MLSYDIIGASLDFFVFKYELEICHPKPVYGFFFFDLVNEIVLCQIKQTNAGHLGWWFSVC